VLGSSEIETVFEKFAQTYPRLIFDMVGHHYGYAPPEICKAVIRDGRVDYQEEHMQYNE